MLKKINQKININNLPIILFIVIIINLLPLAIPNAITKKSCSASTISIIIAFIIQCILLLAILFNNIKLTKKIKINLIILIAISFVNCIIKILSLYLYNTAGIMDILDIACKFTTIASFYILMLDIKIKEDKIWFLVKGIVYLIVIACLFNMIFYSQELINSVFKGELRKNFQVFKSFFGNRNQFAFFLYLGIAIDTLIMLKDKKLRYKIFFVLFLFNLIIGISRTAMLISAIFLFLFLITTDKIKPLDKLEIAMLILIAILIITLVLIKLKPDLVYKILTEFVNTYIRPSSLKTLSGRTKLWSLAFTLIGTNLITMFFGYGRFQGISAIKASGKRFTQFHNSYLEALISGGIIELIYILFIYANVFRIVAKSNLENKYKRMYIVFNISSLIYMMSESIGRFSIGIVDVICIICFVTLPILHANSIKINKEEIEVKKGSK